MTSAVGSSPSTTSTTSTTGTTSKTGSTIGTAAGLGKDDFMQLLIAQLKNQDPMKPTDDTQFVAQLAQFSTLEATNKMSDALEELAGMQALGEAAALIGKQVSAKLTDGTVVTGTVSQIHMVDSKAKVVVNGQEIDASLITNVSNTSASTTTGSATTSSATTSGTSAAATNATTTNSAAAAATTPATTSSTTAR